MIKKEEILEVLGRYLSPIELERAVNSKREFAEAINGIWESGKNE